MEREDDTHPPSAPAEPEEYPEPEGGFGEDVRDVMRGLRTLYG